MKQAGEFAGAILREFRNVLGVDEIAGEGDDIGKTRACEASAAPILANTSAHCASMSAGTLPSLSMPICRR